MLAYNEISPLHFHITQGPDTAYDPTHDQTHDCPSWPYSCYKDVDLRVPITQFIITYVNILI